MAKWTIEVSIATIAMNTKAIKLKTRRAGGAKPCTATMKPVMNGISSRMRISIAVNHGSAIGASGAGSAASPTARTAT